jgi:hypothetical protein
VNKFKLIITIFIAALFLSQTIVIPIVKAAPAVVQIANPNGAGVSHNRYGYLMLMQTE